VSDINTYSSHRLSDRLCRDTGLSVAELEERDEGYFGALLGETVDDVQGILDSMYPDATRASMLFECSIRL
jgi:hypothetical protein